MLDTAAAVELAERILQSPGIASIDFETTIDRAASRKLCTVQLAHADGREVMVRLYNDPVTQRRLRRALINHRLDAMPAHFAIMEAECLQQLGLKWTEIKRLKCTYVAARVLYGAMIDDDQTDEEVTGGWGLDDLSLSLLGRRMSKALQKRDWTLPLDEPAIEYGLDDVRNTLDLWILFAEQFKEDPDQLRGFNVVNDAIPIIAFSNLHGGLQLDKAAHNKLIVAMDAQKAEAEFEMNLVSRDAIDNHGSAQQVSRWIADNLFSVGDSLRAASNKFFSCTGLNWGLTANLKQFQLAKGVVGRVIEDVDIIAPQVSRYLSARVKFQKAVKLIQAFGSKLADAVDPDGCIRGSMIPHGARTSRMSCRDPNLQQMPAEAAFRACFKARPGRKIVICDYGQIELRVGCIIADDKRMQMIFKEGFDIHAATAVAVFALGAYDDDNPAHVLARKKAKAPNFAALYGAEAPAIALSTGQTVSEAAEFLAKWLEVYPGIALYRREMPVLGREQGYVQIASGQKIKAVEKTRPAQMINAPVQGGSASVMYRAAVRVAWELDRRGYDAYLALLVHDEILVDSAEECAVEVAKLVQEEMLQALLEFFPLAAELGVDKIADASICDNWGQKDDKDYRLNRYIERMAA